MTAAGNSCTSCNAVALTYKMSWSECVSNFKENKPFRTAFNAAKQIHDSLPRHPSFPLGKVAGETEIGLRMCTQYWFADEPSFIKVFKATPQQLGQVLISLTSEEGHQLKGVLIRRQDSPFRSVDIFSTSRLSLHELLLNFDRNIRPQHAAELWESSRASQVEGRFDMLRGKAFNKLPTVDDLLEKAAAVEEARKNSERALEQTAAGGNVGSEDEESGDAAEEEAAAAPLSLTMGMGSKPLPTAKAAAAKKKKQGQAQTSRRNRPEQTDEEDGTSTVIGGFVIGGAAASVAHGEGGVSDAPQLVVPSDIMSTIRARLPKIKTSCLDDLDFHKAAAGLALGKKIRGVRYLFLLACRTVP
jgi:hypothetical protein